MQRRLFAHPKIEVIWNAAVEEVLGSGQPEVVTGLRLRDIPSGTEQTLAVDGVFIAIGHTPTTSLFRGHVELDDEGYVITQPGQTTTSVPGLFAAGDVQDKHWRQAVTAAGTGCIAALEAERFLTLQATSTPVQAAAVPALEPV